MYKNQIVIWLCNLDAFDHAPHGNHRNNKINSVKSLYHCIVKSELYEISKHLPKVSSDDNDKCDDIRNENTNSYFSNRSSLLFNNLIGAFESV